MDEMKAKLDALSAKAIDGNWMAPPRSSVVGCGIVSAPQGRVVGSGVDADTTAFIAELVNAYRSGQLIAAPEWRDIASAPKDGRYLIVGRFGEACELLWVSHSRWITAHEIAESEGGTADDYEAGWTDGDTEDDPCYPTHWIALPTPPEGDE